MIVMLMIVMLTAGKVTTWRILAMKPYTISRSSTMVRTVHVLFHP